MEVERPSAGTPSGPPRWTRTTGVRGIPGDRRRAPGPAARSAPATTSSPAPGASTRSGSRRSPAGLASRGVQRGDTVALMLATGPSSISPTRAVMHLGATPFSIYNTYTAEQIEHLLQDAGSRVVITEQAHAGQDPRRPRRPSTRIEQVVVVDGEPPAGTISPGRARRAGRRRRFDFEAAWRAVEPDDVLTLIYTSGTTGPPRASRSRTRTSARRFAPTTS